MPNANSSSASVAALAIALAAISGCTQPSSTPAATSTAATPAGDTPAATPSAPAPASDVPAATNPHTPLAAGSQAPAFSAQAWKAGVASDFSLEQALARGPVVLYFFPAAFTPGCNIEARLFSEAIGDFDAKQATVVGITAGNTDQLEAFSKDNETCSGKFAVAADPGARIAAQYGAVLERKPEWASRTSFAIAPDGRILRAYSDSDPANHVREMLAGL